MFVCCVLLGRGLCVGVITRPKESYRMWCVVVCDLEISWMREPWPSGGGCCCAKRERKKRSNVSPSWRVHWTELAERLSASQDKLLWVACHRFISMRARIIVELSVCLSVCSKWWTDFTNFRTGDPQNCEGYCGFDLKELFNDRFTWRRDHLA
jgi:hypothetical protein